MCLLELLRPDIATGTYRGVIHDLRLGEVRDDLGAVHVRVAREVGHVGRWDAK